MWVVWLPGRAMRRLESWAAQLVSELLEGLGRLMLVLYRHPEGIRLHRCGGSRRQGGPSSGWRIFWETLDCRRGGGEGILRTHRVSPMQAVLHWVLPVRYSGTQGCPWGFEPAYGCAHPMHQAGRHFLASHRDLTRGFFL